MKKIVYYFLNKMFGKKRYYRFFLILKNIGLQGLNYKNTYIQKNGELFLMNVLSNYYKKETGPLILFDVGANVVNYARLLTEQFPTHSTIYAFEPFSFPFKQLRTLAATYSNIVPFQIGLSDKEEDLMLYSSETYSEIGGLYNRNFIFQDIPHDKQEKNHFTTLDLFCSEHKIVHIHFLKIDVEGHELAVLKGASSLLAEQHIDVIQFEFGAGNQFSKSYLMDFFTLLGADYTLYRLLADGLSEIRNYSADFEMQMMCNFVALSKHVPKTIIPTIYVP